MHACSPLPPLAVRIGRSGVASGNVAEWLNFGLLFSLTVFVCYLLLPLLLFWCCLQFIISLRNCYRSCDDDSIVHVVGVTYPCLIVSASWEPKILECGGEPRITRTWNRNYRYDIFIRKVPVLCVQHRQLEGSLGTRLDSDWSVVSSIRARPKCVCTSSPKLVTTETMLASS